MSSSSLSRRRQLPECSIASVWRKNVRNARKFRVNYILERGGSLQGKVSFGVILDQTKRGFWPIFRVQMTSSLGRKHLCFSALLCTSSTVMKSRPRPKAKSIICGVMQHPTWKTLTPASIQGPLPRTREQLQHNPVANSNCRVLEWMRGGRWRDVCMYH